MRFWAAKTMNRAAQTASGRPSGIGACELAGFPCKRSYLVSRFYAMVARRHFKAWGHERRNHLSRHHHIPVGQNGLETAANSLAGR